MADLDRFRQKLNRAAAKCVNREVALRLDALYQKLQTGQIPDSVQEKLRSFADAVTAAPRRSVEAQKIIQDLISQYWQQHKYWLTGLKWLLDA